jgi:hypothetical protein
MRKFLWLTTVTVALVILAFVMHFFYRGAYWRTFHRDTDIFIILPVFPILFAEFWRLWHTVPPQQRQLAPKQIKEYQT